MSSIGIKLADGSFYPVLEGDSVQKKRLVLTTVRDNQRSMQINLFRDSEPDKELQYVDSLIIEDIEAAPKGVPSVSFILGIDEKGELSCEAVDLDSCNHPSMQISLKSLDADDSFVFPDYEFDSVTGLGEDDTMSENEEKTAVEKVVYEKKSFPLWLSLLLFFFGLIALGIALYISYANYKMLEEAKAKAETPVSVTLSELEKQEIERRAEEAARKAAEEAFMKKAQEEAAAELALKEQIAREEAAAKLAAEEEAARKAAEEAEKQAKIVKYKIKWGDTLWDIADSYYKNPWKYKTIAKYNGIKNPDYIISGTTISIPPM